MFHGPNLVKQGTVLAPKSHLIFNRLYYIAAMYENLFEKEKIDEVHIETIPRRCHHYTTWSVAVIGLALAPFCDYDVHDDLPVKSWQKHCSWRGNEKDLQRLFSAGSEDETAAICMGLWHLGTKVGV